MADTTPTAWRTVFRPHGGHFDGRPGTGVRHDLGTLSAIAGTKPVAAFGPDSRFAELYRKFERKLSVVMRQHHRPGEKTFIDFCDGIALTNPMTGEKEPTQLFVSA